MSVNLIVDPKDQEVPGNPDDTIEALRQATTADPAPQPDTDPQPSPEPNPDENIPEKYRGKTIHEIIDMHQNLHSAYGRMANDLGNQRKMTDQLIGLKREEDLAKNTPDVPEIDAGDLLDNPSETLDKIISAKTQGIEAQTSDRISNLEAQLAQQSFISRHPDVNEVTATEDFSVYLSRSPVRAELAQRAAQGDWYAADQLMTDYKDYASVARSATTTTQTPDPSIEAARAASLEGGHTAQGVQQQTQGKIYRRVELINLKLEKPEIYGDPEFQKEIVKAYAEGRVK